MEDVSLFLDAPSPSHSYLYTFSDQDQFLDASRSETQSSATSPYDMTFSRDYTGSDTMPSPDVEGEDGSLSPHDQTSATQLKPAAKRKRENRYKNAPPSVLSPLQTAPPSTKPRLAKSLPGAQGPTDQGPGADAQRRQGAQRRAQPGLRRTAGRIPQAQDLVGQRAASASSADPHVVPGRGSAAARPRGLRGPDHVGHARRQRPGRVPLPRGRELLHVRSAPRLPSDERERNESTPAPCYFRGGFWTRRLGRDAAAQRD
ncbi:hypothetical protein FJTKL_04135 [Diaporthe vaccinii]|uniref:Uncharacterized protein n=1 Tax=Diaporthe vaccinii TaxID=105482 RepID=A0ABR4DTV5_9PEZI